VNYFLRDLVGQSPAEAEASRALFRNGPLQIDSKNAPWRTSTRAPLNGLDPYWSLEMAQKLVILGKLEV